MLKASAIHFTWYLYMHNYPYNFIFPSRLFFLIGSPFMSFDVCARPVFTAIKFIEKSLKHTRWILHTCTCHKWINDEESQERGKEWNEMKRNENRNTKIKSESERLKKSDSEKLWRKQFAFSKIKASKFTHFLEFKCLNKVFFFLFFSSYFARTFFFFTPFT